MRLLGLDAESKLSGLLDANLGRAGEVVGLLWAWALRYGIWNLGWSVLILDSKVLTIVKG